MDAANVRAVRRDRRATSISGLSISTNRTRSRQLPSDLAVSSYLSTCGHNFYLSVIDDEPNYRKRNRPSEYLSAKSKKFHVTSAVMSFGGFWKQSKPAGAYGTARSAWLQQMMLSHQRSDNIECGYILKYRYCRFFSIVFIDCLRVFESYKR